MQYYKQVTKLGLTTKFSLIFSRDITIPRPVVGDYYFLLVGLKDFHELLITAILVRRFQQQR